MFHEIEIRLKRNFKVNWRYQISNLSSFREQCLIISAKISTGCFRKIILATKVCYMMTTSTIIKIQVANIWLEQEIRSWFLTNSRKDLEKVAQNIMRNLISGRQNKVKLFLDICFEDASKLRFHLLSFSRFIQIL